MARSLPALMICAAALLAACDEETPEVVDEPRLVVAMQVGAEDVLGSRSFTGLAQAATDAALSFRVGGRLLDRAVSVGQSVSEGQVIARLDDSPYRAEVARLESDLNAAMAELNALEEQYKRVEPLVDSGTYSKARLDEVTGERDSAAARVESVRSALKRAQIDLGDTVLKAPFDGRVVAVYRENFEEVRPQERILRLLDLDNIEIVIDIPETLISLAPLVDTLAVTFDAFPDVELEGRITEIGAEASQTTRTYPVTVTVEGSDDAAILPGMAGTVRAKTVRTDGVGRQIVLPPAALRPRVPGSDEMAVWVVDPATGVVSLRPVSTGRIVRGGVVIREGLTVGEWVVTAGANSLVEGQKVRLPKDEAAS